MAILNHLRAREQAQVVYIIPLSSILGRLPVVPVGEKGTIPFEALTCEENQRTFPKFLELLATKARTVAMDVGGDT